MLKLIFKFNSGENKIGQKVYNSQVYGWNLHYRYYVVEFFLTLKAGTNTDRQCRYLEYNLNF